jgi:hypothetical protein
MPAFNVEYTDTFGGEANYSWVRRATIRVSEDHGTRAIMKAAKKAAGLAGVDGRWHVHNSDALEFRPYRMCTVLFVNWTEDEYAYDAQDETAN